MTSFFKSNDIIKGIQFLGKWTLLTIPVGLFSGIVGALFLYGLQEAADFRMQHISYIVFFLPLAGILVAMAYHVWGGDASKGNNLVINEINKGGGKIPWIMTPLVVLGTLISHVFGASVGREGTAVQLGASIADQFPRLFKLDEIDRKVIILSGVAAGFAAVFGTPFTAIVFSLEVAMIGKIRTDAIFPVLMASLFGFLASYQVSDFIGYHHVHYQHIKIPEISFLTLLWVVLGGIVFGVVAKYFSILTAQIQGYFNDKIDIPFYRPFAGGIIFVVTYYMLFFLTKDTSMYLGLGVDTIRDSFTFSMPIYAFAIKFFLTALCVGAGFRGGEVTPLFFIGALLGNALAVVFPGTLPMELWVGLGFVAVFSGAAKTPIACAIMGMELFGAEAGILFLVVCVVSFMVSGKHSIYADQLVAPSHHFLIGKDNQK